MQSLQTQILLPLNSPRKNLEIIHGRKLISLFTAISIFLTSMEEVILLGLPGTTKTLFTWSGGPRSSGVGFFCFASPRAWKQKTPTPLDRGPPLHVNRPSVVIHLKF